MTLCNRMTSRFNMLVGTLACAAFALAGCGSDSTSASRGGGENIKVTALIAGTNIPYLASYQDGLESAAQKEGVQLTSLSADFDASKQAQQFSQAIASKPDVIVLVAVDTKSVVPSLLAAQKAGVPVLVSNAGVDPSAEKYTAGYTGPDEILEAELSAQLMVEAIGTTGNVIIVQGALGSNGQVLRDKGFTEELAKIAPDIKVLDKQPGNWEQGAAQTASEAMLTRFGSEVDGVFAHADPMAAGAVQAIEDAGLTGTVKVVGLGGSKQGFDGIKDGAIYGTTIQSPVEDAELAIQGAEKVARGEKVPAHDYMKPVKVTKENVDDNKADW